MQTKNYSNHRIDSIVIFTLNSLYSGVGLYRYFEEFHSKIALVCISKRYGSKYGSFFSQLSKNVKRSGISFVHYLSYHFVYFHLAEFIFSILNRILGRKDKVYSVWRLIKKYNIPYIYTNEPNQKCVVDKIKSVNPDLIIVTYFDHIIKNEIISIPKYGIINVHTALLPKYRGPFPALWAMIKKDELTGVTVHYIDDETLDTGPIIKQSKLSILPRESVLNLDCRLVRCGVELAISVVKEIDMGELKSVIRKNNEQNLYYSYPSKKDLENRSFKLSSIFDFLRQFI